MVDDAPARIGSYTVLGSLGAGGMSQIYRARDSRLGREVAIKVLSDRSLQDPDALERFSREARAASALSHPNIITIYDTGEIADRHYIVMELVKGRTLRSLMDGDPPAAETVRDVGVQIARALAAAHDAGIVHRDIKPENIMVRDDGYVKVVDFGVARLMPALRDLGLPDSVATKAGMLVGTPRYMSPEQAFTEPLSGASDIFSLGVVFYEWTTGRYPFAVGATLRTLSAIVNDEPLPPARVNPRISEGLNALIVDMLQKDPARRPGAADVAERLARPGEVESLEERLDSWKEIAAFLGRGVRTVQRWEREEGLPVHRLLHDKRGSIYARKQELAAWWESRRLTLSAPTPDPTPAPVPASVAAPAATRVERVTWTSAMTNWPTLSSDARLIAYVSDGGQDGTTPQIWIQQIGGAALQLTSAERAYSFLSFSPDDTRIIYTASDASGQSVFEVPALGGEPRLLQRGATRGQISPDGLWLATVPLDGVGIQIAARRGNSVRAMSTGLVDVAWAMWLPDSRSMLVHARPDATVEADWWVVPIDGSPPTNTGLVVRLFREAGLFTLPTGAAWVDGTLVFSGADRHGVSLYRQRFMASTFQPVGLPEQLTSGGETAWLPTAAAGRVAFVSSRADSNLWSIALDPATGIAQGPLRRMTRGLGILGFLSVTNDGQTLAYFSVRLGSGDVFLRDLATGSERVLAEGPDGEKGYPAISPSGKLVAFSKRLPGAAERALRPIFVVSLPDGSWRQIGDDFGGRPREWVDERRLVIERFARLNSIALVDTDTGDERSLLESAQLSIKNPRLSPDRRWIAFDASRPSEPANVQVARFGEQPIPESQWITVGRCASHPFWSADGRLLYYTPIGTNPMVRSAVRARPFDSGAGPVDGTPIAVYASTEMFMPAYLAGTAPIATPDQIMLILGDFRGDVWLMDLAK